MEYRLITVAILVCFLGITCAGNMPDYIKICHRNDPELSKCVKQSVHNLRPYLGKGIKEINVPALEPLYIGDLSILEASSGGITVRAKKLNIYGASNFEITKMRASIQNKRFDFELVLPHDVKNVNDIDYFDVKEFGLKIRTGKGRLRLDNLFNGDKVLGDVINQTINDNFELFTNEVIAPIARALEVKFLAIATKILENFTYNELFQFI